MESSLTCYSIGEEIANSITHGIGVILAIVALVTLIACATTYGSSWHIVSVSIYGSTLVLLYSASTLYHSIRKPVPKSVFQILDHSAIYILIAGTYTPFTLVNLRGPWGWSIFAFIWLLAFIGIVLQFGRMIRLSKASLFLYIGMGWTIIVAIKPLIASVETGGIILLFLGGISYTLGLLFYRWETLKFNHAVWHLFVLAGSILHFFAVLFYVIPIKS
jgi:hemolysin III